MISPMNKLVFWLTFGVIITFVLINMGVQKEVLIIFGLIILGVGGLARRMLGTYFQAVKELKRNRYDTAIRLFEEFISEIKYNPDLLKWQKFATFSTEFSFKETAFLNLGVCYWNKRQYKEAISAFKKATEIRPEMVESYLNIAMIHFNQGNREECYLWLEKAKPYRNEKFNQLLIESSYFDSIRNEKRFQDILN
jgi:tetratricopeptide (TPR) repeat protein